jgi:hypothetical protein
MFESRPTIIVSARRQLKQETYWRLRVMYSFIVFLVVR